ncbi:MAG: hypothetical protein LBN02_06230 [Oscillospiraceae bacterium]|jgi:hypothetical protein|nr:hypothetical protein [Oscillospiraceae bacterium]
MVYDNNSGGEYAKYFVQTLQEPADMGTPAFRALYAGFAKRILWMDGDVVPGAFQMNTAWYAAVPARDPIFDVHAHDYDELIGFFGSDPAEPYNLNAELEFTIEGEAHRLTRSTMIFVPGGLKHNPLRILRVDRPMFHFSVVMNPKYDGEEVYR